MLKPFELATSQLSGELYLTLGSVYPLIHGIFENHLPTKQDDPLEIIYFKNTVMKMMKTRFKVENKEPCDNIVASALHPG